MISVPLVAASEPMMIIGVFVFVCMFIYLLRWPRLSPRP